MVKPVSGACNLACDYCFYRDVALHRAQLNYGRMTLDTLEVLIRRACAYADDQLSFAFQGGEPMLAGLSFYQDVVRLQRKYNTRNVPISNAIQTNGILLNDEWAAFFRENHFLVGVSLDGTQTLHDLHRITAQGEGTYDAVMNGIQCLQRQKTDFNILCVITQEATKYGYEIYDTLQRYGYLQFIPCIDSFDATQQNTPLSDAYATFLSSTFERYERAFYRGKMISIRTFDNYLSILLGRQPENCAMRGVCGRYYLLEADGGIYPCDFYVLDEWRMGNIHETNFKRLASSPVAERFVARSLRLPEQCQACQWRYLCRGGCSRDCEPITEGQRQLNQYCESYKQFFLTYEARLKKMAQRINEINLSTPKHG